MTQKSRLRLVLGGVIPLLAAIYVVPFFVPGVALYSLLGGVVVGLLVVLWWLVLSKAPWSERLGALVLMALTIAATKPLLHLSMATAGQGYLFYIFPIPLLALLFLVWAVASRGLGSGARWASMAATIVLATSVWTLVRTGGITGDGRSDFRWRWSETPEERLLAGAEPVPLPSTSVPAENAASPAPAEVAEPTVPAPLPAASDLPTAPPPAPVEAKAEAEWPGFRGPGRDSVIPGVWIETDWSKSPPVELWRRPIGPGWSSFAVGGNRIYTQEQRGEDEIVACYDARTGEPVWMHRDAARFYESNGGPGPRGTPTLRHRRVYTFGATGIVNVLDAEDGSLVWSRNVGSDADRKIPFWGFASSPLVLEDMVIVAAAGKLVAYDLATGEPLWFGPPPGGGYSSPQLATIDGVEQVLLLTGKGVVSVAPADGSLLWEHAWSGDGIVQPTVTAEGDVLLGTGSGMGADAGMGVRSISVAHGSGGWSVEERWTSIRLKPYFNDFVVHRGHAYGFDGSILACLDLANGERKWKGGRYGHGQLVLLPDQDLLLVLSEEGELALVRAVPDGFTELARIPAIEGKTWNHPVLVDDLLLVRNGQEMAAFRLSRPES